MAHSDLLEPYENKPEFVEIIESNDHPKILYKIKFA